MLCEVHCIMTHFQKNHRRIGISTPLFYEKKRNQNTHFNIKKKVDLNTRKYDVSRD